MTGVGPEPFTAHLLTRRRRQEVRFPSVGPNPEASEGLVGRGLHDYSPQGHGHSDPVARPERRGRLCCPNPHRRGEAEPDQESGREVEGGETEKPVERSAAAGALSQLYVAPVFAVDAAEPPRPGAADVVAAEPDEQQHQGVPASSAGCTVVGVHPASDDGDGKHTPGRIVETAIAVCDGEEPDDLDTAEVMVEVRNVMCGGMYGEGRAPRWIGRA